MDRMVVFPDSTDSRFGMPERAILYIHCVPRKGCCERKQKACLNRSSEIGNLHTNERKLTKSNRGAQEAAVQIISSSPRPSIAIHTQRTGSDGIFSGDGLQKTLTCPGTKNFTCFCLFWFHSQPPLISLN